MEREEFINNKFITVAGRAASMEEFAAQIKKNLFDNYDIVAIHGLGEFGIDDKERYLAFITGESKSGKTFGAQNEKLREAQFGTKVHETLDEAFSFSKTEYPTFGDAEEQRQKKYQDLSERFPGLKASEIEQTNILESLWANGGIRSLRCLFDGEPVVVLVHVTGGADELRVRPFAMMINEDLEVRLEFPNPDEE